MYINPTGEDFSNHNYMSKIADDQVDQSCCKVDGIQFENYFHAPTPKSGGRIFNASALGESVAEVWMGYHPGAGWVRCLMISTGTRREDVRRCDT